MGLSILGGLVTCLSLDLFPTTVGVEGALFELSHIYLGISVLQGLIWPSYIYSILVWPLIG